MEVSSTRSSGGQDPAGGSVDAGRGGRGRGRGRGRYDQDYSGGRGQTDNNYAGRGPGAFPSSLLHVRMSDWGPVCLKVPLSVSRFCLWRIATCAQPEQKLLISFGLGEAGVQFYRAFPC